MARPAIVSHWSLHERAQPAHPVDGPTLPVHEGRLLIRGLEREDLDKRQSWPPFNDPLHLIWDMPRCSARENDSWFHQMNDGRHRLAYAVDNASDNMIGMISLREIDWRRSARLGIALSSQYVGQGLGTSAMRLFLPYYFRTLGFERMFLDVAAANFRAVRCYQKLAFRKAATRWQGVAGPLAPSIFDQPAYAPLRAFFRWKWGRFETLFLDMELVRVEWEEKR